nr:hypothetical protein [Clostridiales bacterium]
MNIQYYLNIFLFTVITIPYTIAYIGRHKLSPVSIFLIMEISMFYGICFYNPPTTKIPSGTSDVAIKLETLYVIAIIFFILGVEFSKFLSINKKAHKKYVNIEMYENAKGSFSDTELSGLQTQTVWFMIIVSILLSVYLFAVGGTNIFVEAIRDVFRNDTYVYRNERMAYSTVRGVGYIYQFRAVILPLLTSYVIFATKKKYPLILKIPLV